MQKRLILSGLESSHLGKRFNYGQKPQVSLGLHLKVSQIKLKPSKNWSGLKPVGLFNCIPLSSTFSKSWEYNCSLKKWNSVVLENNVLKTSLSYESRTFHFVKFIEAASVVPGGKGCKKSILCEKSNIRRSRR